jgi:hypothetical protein
MRRLPLILLTSVGLLRPAFADQLTGAEIKETISGHTFVWKSAKFNSSGVTKYNADGTMTVTMDGGKGPEQGKWRIKGNQICGKTGKNKEGCSDVRQIDQKTFFWEAYKTTSVKSD